MDAEAVRPIQDHQAAKQAAPFPHGRKKASAPIGAKAKPTLWNQVAGQWTPAIHGRIKTLQHRLETCLASDHTADIPCPAAAMGEKSYQ
jgi:hypothetical protein